MINSTLISKLHSHFRKLALLTVVVLYVLILIGGIVRSTGSGMGCPDWPKCFGQWVPPTDVSELPQDYQKIFGAKLKGEVNFNAVKTWIEYLNRLFGVFTGLFIFATLIASIPYLRRDKVIFYISLLAFLLVGFQGWLGSKVVSTELSPVLVTLHMMLAVVIVFLLLYVLARSYSGHLAIEQINSQAFLTNWLMATLIVSLIQICLGTQVREAIDVIARRFDDKNIWIEQLGLSFYIHRSLSILILGLHIGLIYYLLKEIKTKGLLWKLSCLLFTVIACEIIFGIILAYWALPAFAQPVHLTLAIIAVGIQFVFILLLNVEKVFKIQ
jgi:heme a synthase